MVRVIIQKNVIEKLKGFGLRKAASSFILVVLVIGTGVTYYELQRPQDIRQRASQIEGVKDKKALKEEKINREKLDITSSTAQIKGLIANYQFKNEYKDRNSKEITTLLAQRKEKLLQLLHDDSSVIDEFELRKYGEISEELFFPDSIIQELTPISPENVEKKVTLNGNYSFLHKHGDDFDNPEAEENTYMLSVEEKAYKLVAATPISQLVTGSSATVEGYQIGDTILVTTLNSKPVSSKVLGSSTPTTMNIAVIATKFTDTSHTYTMDTVRGIFYSDPANNIIDYFKEASFGSLTVTPSFYGIYTLPYTRGQGCTDTDIQQKMVEQADPDIDFSQFSRIMFIQDCNGYMAGSFSAMVTQDGTFPNFKFVFGNSVGFTGSASNMPGVMAHEIAHTLPVGTSVLLHANFYDCKPEAYIPPSNLGQNFGTLCNSLEYGDEFDLLGQSGHFGHLNAYYKKIAGWFSPANYPTITSSGTYTIAPLETNSDSAQGLYIPRGTAGGAFSVEYRQPVGYDANLVNGPKCIGCNVTLGPSIKFLPLSTYIWSKTNAIDTTPNTPFVKSWNGDYMNGAALTPGNTFTDSEYGIAIKTLSANSTGTTVEVTIPTLTCTRNSPTVTISPSSQSVTSLETKPYSVTVKNNDSIGCQPGIFGFSFWNPNANLKSTANPSYLTLEPQTSGTSTLNITGKGSIIDGINKQSVWVISNAYGVPTSYTSGINYVLTSDVDTVPPSVPTNVTAVPLGSGLVKIEWSESTDNLGVVGYNIIRDGIKYGVESTTSFIDLNLFQNTTYTYYVQAFDRKGNVANSEPITFTTPARTDFAMPGACSNLQESYPDPNSITLSWTPGSDNVGIAMYNVLRNGIFYKRLPATATSFTDDNLPLYNTMTTYTINEYDGDNGNNYCQFEFYTGSPGNTPPLHPTGLVATSPEYFKTHLAWNANPESDIASYNIFRGERIIANVTGTSLDDYVSDGTGYYYYVQAVDQEGNRSALSEGKYIFLQPAPSGQPYPSIPVSGTPTPTSIVPTSTPTLVSPSPTPTSTPTPTPIPPTPIPLDNIAPLVSITSPLNGTILKKNTTISLSANATDNVGVTKVEFYVTNILKCTDTTAPYTCSWKTPVKPLGASFIITAKAYDAAGNTGISSVTVTAK